MKGSIQFGSQQYYLLDASYLLELFRGMDSFSLKGSLSVLGTSCSLQDSA